MPEEARELTSTLVFTSNEARFVDVRVYKHQYPHISLPESIEPFEQVFQWVIVGEEEELPGTNRIRFNHCINLAEILQSITEKRPLHECKSPPDIGAFWPMEGSEDRKETGEMVNPETGQATEYVEIWRSLNPNHTTPHSEVREGYTGHHEPDTSSIVNNVFELDQDGVFGRIIRLGNWAQGVVYDLKDTEHPLSVMRRVYENGEWTELIRYGKYEFPSICECPAAPWVSKER